jgi:hypothetical protein
MARAERLTQTSARLVLRGDEGLGGRVRELAAAESSCCSFFQFEITEPAVGSVVVDVMVPVADAGVLDSIIERAEAARARTTT